MDRSEGVCVSSLLTDRQVSIKNPAREGPRIDFDSTSLANPAMVSSSEGINFPESDFSPPPPPPKPSAEYMGRTPSPVGTGLSNPSRMACVRANLENKGISEQASALILASWRKNTEAAYSCSWRKWQKWCSHHAFESVCAPLSAIIEFLSCEFAEGKQYRTLNSYRSAISMTHQPIDGVLVGKHPLICRLLKGIYNSRPPQPRYSTTWDVSKVLDYIRSLGPSSSLNLRQLTHKLAMLLALANASRASELHALNIRFVSRKDGGVSFALADHTKTSGPGKCKRVFLPSLRQDELLCPVVTLWEYLERTTVLRRESHQLFLSFVRPFNPVVKGSIARWLRTLIQEAGVTGSYAAHPLRGAAASAAFLKGMSVLDIIKVADWSSDNTFKAFYYKPVSEQKSLLPLLVEQ